MTNPKDNNNTPAEPVKASIRSLLPPAKLQVIFFIIVILGIAADLLTKSIAFDQVEKKGAIVVIDGFFNIVSVENDGAAFNLFAGRTWLLTTISAVAFVAVIASFMFGRTTQKLVTVSMALLTGGIFGNLYDRLFNNGLVRDFIDVVYWPGKHWPAFNVADSMLCVGVGLMILAVFLTEMQCRKHAPQQKSGHQ